VYVWELLVVICKILMDLFGGILSVKLVQGCGDEANWGIRQCGGGVGELGGIMGCSGSETVSGRVYVQFAKIYVVGDGESRRSIEQVERVPYVKRM
jgi:hypothetical protein